MQRRRVATKPTQGSRERGWSEEAALDDEEASPPARRTERHGVSQTVTTRLRDRRLACRWTSFGSPRLLEELPPERTRLLDNLGRIRREVGPITPELSDALADRMNLRRGDVHEVVSFYSFLQVPVDAVRVCTGPVCDCVGARELLTGAARSRCRASATATSRRSRMRRRRRRAAASPTRRTASCSSRTRLARAARTLSPGRACSQRLEASGPDRDGRRRLPDLAQVGGRPARARPARRDRQRGRGRAGDDQGPLRDGAAPAAPARRARGGDALLRDRRGVHLPARGVRDLPRRARRHAIAARGLRSSS